jgi:hypothetical protein
LLVFFPKATTGLVPIGYRGALLSSLLQVNVYVTNNLLNVIAHIANKMGLNKNRNIKYRFFFQLTFNISTLNEFSFYNLAKYIHWIKYNRLCKVLFHVRWTAWNVLRLRMEERHPAMEVGCEYIE